MNGYGFPQYPQQKSISPKAVGMMLMKHKALSQSPSAFNEQPQMGAPIPDPSFAGTSPRPRIV